MLGILECKNQTKPIFGELHKQKGNKINNEYKRLLSDTVYLKVIALEWEEWNLERSIGHLEGKFGQLLELGDSGAGDFC